MAERAFFYFRDPKYVESIPEEKRADFLSEDPSSTEKQTTLKNLIRTTCALKNISLVETYSDSQSLTPIILEQLKNVIEKQFPKESIPDPLSREARDHESFAEIRRRTYIGRPDYFNALDNHCKSDGKPLLLSGDSGSGKSALIANWVEHWRREYPDDFIFQHYIGGTPDSSIHWKLMTRLMAEIKRWSNDDDKLPLTNDDILRDFPLWLSKARIKANHEGLRFIVILDALNQLDDKDHAHTLGWLPEEPFTGNLRLIVTTLPGPTLEALEKRSLPILLIEPLKLDERGRMIADYLKRFGKSLDKPRIERISNNIASANPLYLKILLDELRITGTHEKLDERLDNYLKTEDIPTLLCKVLERYQSDYEHDRKGLVSEALGLIWSARRGLTESELLQLLRPDNLPQLPLATWSPLRAALEEGLVDRGGILNFTHDFLRTAVETEFVVGSDKKNNFRILLADYFEVLLPTSRSCDELPWLLRQTELYKRLRTCLLNIDCFLEIFTQAEVELRCYWVDLGEESNMGKSYLTSFNEWKDKNTDEKISDGANKLGIFLRTAELHYEAEFLYRLSLRIEESKSGRDHPNVAIRLNNLAQLLQVTNHMSEAETLMRRAIKISEVSFGKDHPNVAIYLNNLGQLLHLINRNSEAETLMRRALKISEARFGKDHPNNTKQLNNLSVLLLRANRINEAEQLIRLALKIDEETFGKDHPNVARDLNNLAQLLKDTNRMNESEPLMRRALFISESIFGKDHPNVARDLNNLAWLLKQTNHIREAEPLMRRAIKIDEDSFGEDHPQVAIGLNNLALLLQNNNRMSEAESLSRRQVDIFIKFTRTTGHCHPHLKVAINNYVSLLEDMGWSEEKIFAIMKIIAPEFIK